MVGVRSKASSSADLITPHKDVHAELKPYTELMLWLKECNPTVFDAVLEVSSNALLDCNDSLYTI